MKINKFTIEPQTGGESDMIAVFKSTVELECPSWVYTAITAMGHGGQRLLMHHIEPSVRAQLDEMYKRLEASGGDTIGDGLHWRDGVGVMGYIHDSIEETI